MTATTELSSLVSLNGRIVIPSTLTPYCAGGDVIPHWLSQKQFEQRCRDAKRLTLATDGAIEVRYSPEGHFDGDEAAVGHLFEGYVNVSLDLFEITLDDRKGDIEAQFLAHLSRLAQTFRMLKNDAERRLRERKR